MSRNYLFTVLLLLGSALSQRLSAQSSIYSTIIGRIQDDLLSTVQFKDSSVTKNLSVLQANGSWADINYADRSLAPWVPKYHLERVLEFALAYVSPSSHYYDSDTLQQAIVKSLTYWDLKDPRSDNWWHNDIGSPKLLCKILIVLRKGKDRITDSLENSLISQMTRGNPASQTGANKVDEAVHFIYRGCLKQDSTVTAVGVNQAYMPIALTSNAEGLQHDFSFRQHGEQLHIGSYGIEFVKAEVEIATYVHQTKYAFPEDKIALLSKYVRNALLRTVRGRLIDFNVQGRKVTRVDGLDVGYLASYLEKLKILDPSNSAEYQQAIGRLDGSTPASTSVAPLHTQFWRSDYSLHNRPGYLFGVRTVSSRTYRCETVNSENLKGRFLTEGVTTFGVNGNEYDNIAPVWEWTKIPGTTVPQVSTTLIPLNNNNSGSKAKGNSKFTGGVSDSTYGATAHVFNEFGVKAWKSWFFFDNEIVCLGAAVSATALDTINTTVNQSLLDGPITVSTGASPITLGQGSCDYSNNLNWVLHDSIGYFFPAGGKLKLRAQTQTGNWKSINNSYSDQTVSKNVFKLWFDHGVKPANTSYAYIIVPNKVTAGDMQNYNINDVTIMKNDSIVQAVRHNGLKIWQVIFYSAGTFAYDSVSISVDQPCILQIKDVGSTRVTMHIADPSQTKSTITVDASLPGIDGPRRQVCTLPTGAYRGSSLSWVFERSPIINQQSLDENTIYPIADTYAWDGTSNATRNFGSETKLMVKKDVQGYNRISFLKFDLSNIQSAIDTVKLRLTLISANQNVSKTQWQLWYCANDTWTETGLNWNNKPASSTLIGTVPGKNSGTAVWDVTSFVKAQVGADKVITFAIVGTVADSKSDATFYSKEFGNQGFSPRLSIIVNPQINLEPVADAYVRDGSANGNRNFGADSLTVKKDVSSYNRISYLKFDLSQLEGQFTSAKLRLNIAQGNVNVSNTNWQLWKCSNDSWTETGITWNNKPGTVTAMGLQPGKRSGEVEWDVTDQLNMELATDKIVTFAILSTTVGSTTDAKFYSKESADPNLRPLLVLSGSSPTSRLLAATLTEKIESADDDTFSVAAFPNPSSSMFNIRITSTTAKRFQVRVTDLAGRVVTDFETTPGTIQIGDKLNAGIYTIAITQGITRKVIKVVRQ